jgi:hypothetical protein
MVGGPSGGRETGDALDRDVAQSRKNRSQIFPYRKFHPTAAFHHRENRCDLGACLETAHMDPILPTESNRAHGVFRDVVTQLKFGMIQEAGKFRLQRELGPSSRKTQVNCR